MDWLSFGMCNVKSNYCSYSSFENQFNNWFRQYNIFYEQVSLMETNGMFAHPMAADTSLKMSNC